MRANSSLVNALDIKSTLSHIRIELALQLIYSKFNPASGTEKFSTAAVYNLLSNISMLTSMSR